MLNLFFILFVLSLLKYEDWLFIFTEVAVRLG